MLTTKKRCRENNAVKNNAFFRNLFTRAVQALKFKALAPERKVISYHFAPLAQMNQLPWLKTTGAF